MSTLDFIANFAIYPCMAMLCVGLLFIHRALRKTASALSFLSMLFLVAWRLLAHRVVYLYTDLTAIPGATEPYPFERIGIYSAHPLFDKIDGVVSLLLLATFFVSFFISAASIPGQRSDPPRPTFPGEGLIVSTPLRILRVCAALSFTFSIFCALWYYQLAVGGGSLVTGTIVASIAIVGVFISTLLAAFTIRRMAS